MYELLDEQKRNSLQIIPHPYLVAQGMYQMIYGIIVEYVIFMHKILVADDETDLLSITKSLLERNGFHVCAISTGKDIDAVISSFKPDLILLDISLGNSDGRTICKEIKTRKETSHVQVLLFSGNSNVSESVSHFLADGFVEKPFSKQQLLTSINGLLK
jgi:DNA-binding response OmpR family regulator